MSSNKKRIEIDELLGDDSFHAYVNQSEPHAISKWEGWVNKNPESKEIIEKASGIITTFGLWNNKTKKAVSSESEYKQLFKRINHQQLIADQTNKNKFKILFRVAAAIAVIFAAISIYFIYNQVITKDRTVVYNEITSPKGSKSKITLEDGTLVWLNAESTLKYPTEFNDNKRKVFLTGEAYFKVKKDNNRPFTVRTGDIKINVLGTSFNVKNYPENDAIETFLESGVINVYRKTKNGEKPSSIITLQPNQKLVLYKDKTKNKRSKSHEKIQKRGRYLPDDLKLEPKKPKLYKNVETEDYTAWKDHRLVINEECLGSLSKRLERWYDVNIIIEGEHIKKRTLTGVFEKETVEQAISAICLTAELKFTIDKDTIKIYQ